MVDWIESHHKYQRAGAPALSWSLKTVSRIRWHTAAQSECTLASARTATSSAWLRMVGASAALGVLQSIRSFGQAVQGSRSGLVIAACAPK